MATGFITSATSTTDAASYNFGNFSNDANSLVIAAVGGRRAAAGTMSITSVSIGGTNGTGNTTASGRNTSGVNARVCSTTPSNVTVTFDSTASRAGVAVYDLIEYASTTPTDIQQATGSSGNPTTTQAVLLNDFVVATVWEDDTVGSSTTAATANTVTEDVDTNIEADGRFAAVHFSAAVANASLSIVNTPSDNTRGWGMASASWPVVASVAGGGEISFMARPVKLAVPFRAALHHPGQYPFLTLQRPATNTFNWANPRGYVPAVVLRTHVEGVKLNLLGKDKFFGAAGMGPDYDWPNPRGYRYPTHLRVFVDPLKLALFSPPTPVADGFGNPNPRGYPFPIEDRGFFNAIAITLLGLDQFYGNPGQGVPQRDFPNPRGYTYPNANRGYTQSFNISLLNIFPAAQGFGNPNPRGYPYPLHLRTFTQSRQSGLADTFFGVAGNPLRDFPNPIRVTDKYGKYWTTRPQHQRQIIGSTYRQRGTQFTRIWARDPKAAISAQTGVWQNRANLTDFFFGLAGNPNRDFPNPRLPRDRWGYSVRAFGETWQDYTLLGIPSNVPAAMGFGDPNPRIAGDRRGVAMRSWTETWQNYDPLGYPAIIPQSRGAQDPNPRLPGDRRGVAMRSWTETWSNYNPLGYPIQPPPGHGFGEPNPVGGRPERKFPLVLRGFTDSFKLTLIGQDTFYGDPGQGPPQRDWPNPRGYPRLPNVRTFYPPTFNWQVDAQDAIDHPLTTRRPLYIRGRGGLGGTYWRGRIT